MTNVTAIVVICMATNWMSAEQQSTNKTRVSDDIYISNWTTNFMPYMQGGIVSKETRIDVNVDGKKYSILLESTKEEYKERVTSDLPISSPKASDSKITIDLTNYFHRDESKYYYYKSYSPAKFQDGYGFYLRFYSYKERVEYLDENSHEWKLTKGIPDYYKFVEMTPLECEVMDRMDEVLKAKK